MDNLLENGNNKTLQMRSDVLRICVEFYLPIPPAFFWNAKRSSLCATHLVSLTPALHNTL